MGALSIVCPTVRAPHINIGTGTGTGKDTSYKYKDRDGVCPHCKDTSYSIPPMRVTP